MMSMRSKETKHLIQKGLQNICNPFIDGMAQKNSYSLKGKLTPIGVAFYIAPYVNAVVRSGTLDEKNITFQSMLFHKAYEKIPSTKRGHKEGDMESILSQALRVVTNVKNRQTKVQDTSLAFFEKMIEEQNLLENKVLLLLVEPGTVDRNVAGLIANKLMAKYQRPCCILTKVTENDNISYQGSARGYDKSGITNFKDICAEFPRTIFASGHQGAFGLGIPADAIPAFIEYTNEKLKDMSSEPIYQVDYIWQPYNVKPNDIVDIANLEYLWGKDMDEPLVAIENIKVTPDKVQVYKGNTLKIQVNDKVALMMFNADSDLIEKLSEDGYKNITVIGRCNKNEWNGNISAQVFIEDLEIVSQGLYLF